MARRNRGSGQIAVITFACKPRRQGRGQYSPPVPVVTDSRRTAGVTRAPDRLG